MKQLVCPKCKYEFTYFNGELDAEIAFLNKEVTSLHEQFREYKSLPLKQQRERLKWRQYASNELRKKQEKLKELKTYRKLADQQIMKMSFHLFKELTKEYVGQVVYRQIIEKMEADLEAYKVSGCMMHEYTRSQHMSSVTSINKL